MKTIPSIGQRIYHPDCGMGIVVYVEGDRVAALWERAEERREVPIIRCGLTACNACLGAADADGYCMEGCCDDDDTRCVDCVMGGCHGTEGGEDCGESCPCNFACHDADELQDQILWEIKRTLDAFPDDDPTLPMVPAVKVAVRTVRA